MTLYNDNSFDRSQQLLRTSRPAFGVMLAFAYLLSAILFGSVAPQFRERDLLPFLLSSSLFGLIPAFAGLVIGATLVLALGGKLSRQFCWIFCLAIGVFAVPMAMMFFEVALEIVPSNSISPIVFSRISGVGIFVIPTTEIICIIGGIVVGVRLTRRRRGFARPAMVITRIILCTVAPLTCALAIAAYSQQRFPYASELNVLRAECMVLGCALACALGALFRTERFESRSFEVVPIASSQTMTAADQT